LNSPIYKVLTQDEWKQAQISGLIITDLDQKDGFIHLSTATQLNATLSLYFYKEKSVVLLELDFLKTNEQIKFETPTPPGKRIGSFPHYYGELSTNTISRTWDLKRSAFELPLEVMLQAEHVSSS
jgi:uncharacterized protein (DUF952 family)